MVGRAKRETYVRLPLIMASNERDEDSDVQGRLADNLHGWSKS